VVTRSQSVDLPKPLLSVGGKSVEGRYAGTERTPSAYFLTMWPHRLFWLEKTDA